MTSPPQPGSISNERFATVSIDYKVSREDLIVVRRADWNRIHGNVKKLKNPAPFLPQVGWAAATTGAGALLSLAAWIPAYGQLPAHAQATYDWITPSLAIFGVMLILVAVLCWALNSRVTRFEQVAVDSVLDDMDACANLAETTPAPESISSPYEWYLPRNETIALNTNVNRALYTYLAGREAGKEQK